MAEHLHCKLKRPAFNVFLNVFKIFTIYVQDVFREECHLRRGVRNCPTKKVLLSTEIQIESLHPPTSRGAQRLLIKVLGPIVRLVGPPLSQHALQDCELACLRGGIDGGGLNPTKIYALLFVGEFCEINSDLTFFYRRLCLW